MRASRQSFVAMLPLLLAGLMSGAAAQAPSSGTGSTTVNAPSAVRVIPSNPTGQQRWHKYVSETFTTPPIYYAALGSAIGDQSSNTPKPWGRTWEGYAKRAGTNYATFAIQTSLYDGGSALFHNLDRYVRCQCSGGWHRAGYAPEMTLLTYHNGHKVLDVPQVVAAYGSGLIPVLWLPPGYDSPSAQGIQRGTVQLGWVGGVREIQEFAPELKRFFRNPGCEMSTVVTGVSVEKLFRVVRRKNSTGQVARIHPSL